MWRLICILFGWKPRRNLDDMVEELNRNTMNIGVRETKVHVPIRGYSGPAINVPVNHKNRVWN